MISKATLSDVHALYILANSAYRGESSKQGWTTEADLLGGIRITEERLTDMFKEPGSTILKYTGAQNEILACVHLEKHEEKLYLGLLTVSPLLQGKGIGKELLFASEQEATKLNCHVIYMTVLEDRTELIAWYLRHGYQKTGERKPFSPDEGHFGIPKKHLEFVVLEKKIRYQV